MKYKIAVALGLMVGAVGAFAQEDIVLVQSTTVVSRYIPSERQHCETLSAGDSFEESFTIKAKPNVINHIFDVPAGRKVRVCVSYEVIN